MPDPATAPPTLDEIRDQIARIATAELGDGLSLSPDGDLAEQLDSVQRLTLVVAIEDHFEIAFEPEDDAAVRTLQAAAAVVAARLTPQRPDPDA